MPLGARRIDWEELLPVIGKAPNRLYIPDNLLETELIQLKKRFEEMEVNMPVMGYYDYSGRFTSYERL